MLLKKDKHNSGQAVLIVLLSLSVVLIIVLYIMSRSITDISLTSKEEDSMRAFSAAEAGIERALVIGTGGEGSFGEANFSASVTGFASGASTVVYPLSLKSGEMATFWLSREDEATSFSGNQIKLCWGTSDTETPAVEASIYYLDAGEHKIARFVYDDASLGRTTSNNFDSANNSPCLIGDVSFNHQSTLDVSGLGALQFMTVKLLYNSNVNHKVGIDVTGYGILPSQGVIVNSDGSFGQSNRSIEVYELHPVAPSVFMNALYSSGNIVKE